VPGRRDLLPRDATHAGSSSITPSGFLVGINELNGLRGFEALPEGLPPLRILVVDDDAPVRKACCEIVSGMGFVPLSAGSVPEARAVLEQQQIDMLLLDLKLPGGGGLKLLEEVKTQYPETGVVVMTAFATVSSAVEAMKIGAGDYLTKPFALEELTSVLGRSSRRLSFDIESRRLRERLRTQTGLGDLIGRSPEMEKVYRILSKVAFSSHPVLILGESGTGKEMVARSSPPSSRASSSVTSRAPSPAPTAPRRACWQRPREAPSSSTR
jgi:two-component system response regulator HydG